jgi:hypothetical protein
MAKIADLAAAIDAFMAASKRIVGYDAPPQWGLGYTPHERMMKYPLEIEGEQRGAQFVVVGFPRERELKFRFGILFSGMVCRLDYTDETHTNSFTGILTGAVPYVVRGPHYHSWPLNRRFFRGVTVPPRLHDAAPFAEPGRSFDAVLRWFCTDTKIDQLPTDHRIALPGPDHLL